MRNVNETRLKFYLSDHDIYEYYFGRISFERKFRSPFRRDPVPSLSFYKSKDVIRWRDFGLPEQKGSDGIAFVQHLFDISRDDAIYLIWDEIIEDNNIPKRLKPLKSTSYNFTVEEKELTYELNYFRKAFINKPLLDFYNVHGVEAAKINNDCIFNSTEEDPAFLYKFGDNSFKTYRPLAVNKTRKFRGSNNGNVMEGWQQLPQKGDHLFINKSLKDSMVLRNMGILSTNPSGEGSLQFLKSKIRELNARFSTIRILFDYDPAGIKSSTILKELTGWENVFLDKEKDCYDNVVKYGNYFWLSNFFKQFNLNFYDYRN